MTLYIHPEIPWCSFTAAWYLSVRQSGVVMSQTLGLYWAVLHQVYWEGKRPRG